MTLMTSLSNAVGEHTVPSSTWHMTLGAQVEDLFYITDYQRQPITDPAAQAAIREIVQRNLGELSELKPAPAVYNI